MNGWVIVIGLALAVFAALAWLFKTPRQGWEVIGAAVLLGIAGFAMQARPMQPGAPKAADEAMNGGGEALVKARQQLANQANPAANQWLLIGDALARNGQFGDAAGVVLGAVEKDPRNADAWLALANDLTAHAQGNLTPASLYSYQRAMQADPRHPGPPFFMGLAMAQAGRLNEARKLWADLLARSPAGAPWRGDLAARLNRLDMIIAMRQRQQQQAAQGVPQEMQE